MRLGNNRIKGLALRNFHPVLAALTDARTADVVVAELPDEIRDAIRGGTYVPTAWYPIDHYRTLHAVARRVTKAGPQLAWRIGHESTRRDLTGVYRVFLSILAPQTLLSASARVFSRYYEQGTMRVPELRKGFARVRLAGCEGFDANVYQDVIGGSVAGLELAGAKHVRVHVEEGGEDGDTTLEVIAMWTS